MIEYSKFYEAEHLSPNDDLPKNEETLCNKTELDEYIDLIQKLGYAYFND